jgi:hypothetical protein
MFLLFVIQLQKAFFLPSMSTVKDYKRGLKTEKVGGHIMLENLRRYADSLQGQPDWERNVCLCWDAMKMRENVIYNANTNEIIGLDDGFGEDTALMLEFSKHISAPLQCDNGEVSHHNWT